MKLRLLPYEQQRGLDIQVLSEETTVADFCDALDEFILNGKIARLRSKTEQCEGCDICCGERMPLTSLDILRLRSALDPQLSLGDFLNKYCYVSVSCRVVDILLKRDDEDRCIFLNKKTSKCSRYDLRPLVCRIYICTALSGRAERFRQELVNSGEDELVRQWLDCLQRGEVIFNEADDPDIRPEDWPENAWTNKISYADIRLRDILSPGLWNELSK